MTGLNLETFLQLLRVGGGAWAFLGLFALILGLMTWTSWGRRKALRNCLVLSIAAHVGLVVYGGTSPSLLKALRLGIRAPEPDHKTERIRVTPWVDEARKPGDPNRNGPDGRATAKNVARWDQDQTPIALARTEAERIAPRPESNPVASPKPVPPPPNLEPLAVEAAAPRVDSPAPPPMDARVATEPARLDEPPTPLAVVDPVPPPTTAEAAPTASTTPGPSELAVDGDLRARSRQNEPKVARPSPRPGALGSPFQEPISLPPALPAVASGSRPGPPLPPTPAPRPATASDPATRPVPANPEGESTAVAAPSAPAATADSSSKIDLPEPDLRQSPRPGPTRSGTGALGVAPPPRLTDGPDPLAMARVTPADLGNQASPRLSAPSSSPTTSRVGRLALTEVPSVYRSRLDPNRASLAQKAGASLASEQAVERALDWLARHQDADGRWDGATAKNRDGSPVNGENGDSFTIHCPPGEVCFGECFYWEADTALTGLSLLAYLGAGYTHLDGKYAATVAKGVEFLRTSQKANGDLRGPSLAVGMYCHAIATLALCEAYALTGDARLAPSVEKAVDFLIKSKSVDGMAWRYRPGAADSDSSILGWAVMALKSAKVVGIPIPTSTQAGMMTWLKKVSSGRDGGLARYQPNDPKVTPTMTAEVWACRQFLEVGGPGRSSDEAAAFLLQNETDRGDFNIYYLYYGTLAMYQQGGDAWSTWNGRVRDQIVNRQAVKGHKAGSWDPDNSLYGTHGGRIYTTALSTLTLEVYYRFLRLYEPSRPPAGPMAPKPNDSGTRRAGFGGGKP